MTIPNILTLSRIALIPVFIGLFYLQPDYYDETLPWINNLLVAIFIIISLTDFFDGLLARKLQQTSELGAFLDPVADQPLMIFTGNLSKLARQSRGLPLRRTCMRAFPAFTRCWARPSANGGWSGWTKVPT